MVPVPECRTFRVPVCKNPFHLAAIQISPMGNFSNGKSTLPHFHSGIVFILRRQGPGSFRLERPQPWNQIMSGTRFESDGLAFDSQCTLEMDAILALSEGAMLINKVYFNSLINFKRCRTAISTPSSDAPSDPSHTMGRHRACQGNVRHCSIALGTRSGTG